MKNVSGTMLDKILGKLIKATMVALAYLPRPLSQWLGRRIGDVSAVLRTRAYLVTVENLQLCFPGKSPVEIEKLARASLRATGQTVMETPATWFRSEKNLNNWIAAVHNEDLIVAAMASGDGMLLLLPHFGNWELINPYFVRHGSQTGIYQPPRQAYLKELVASARHNFGHLMVPTTRQGLVTLYRKLAEGSSVCVLPDQIPAKGEFAPFFGVATLTDQLSSRLVQKSGAHAMAAAIARRPDGRFEITFMKADDGIYSDDPVTAATAINRTVEACVNLAPEQYQWEYKRFRERPPGAPKAYRFGKATTYH